MNISIKYSIMRNLALFIVVPLSLASTLSLNDEGRPVTFKTPVIRESKWTGQLTLEERMTGPVGNSTRTIQVRFINALPTLFRNDPTTELNFTDDKGTGSVTFKGESYIGSKKIGITDCQGSGVSELHEVSVDESDNTYRIHAIGPACNGTSTNLLDGKTESYGPEYTDIIVSDQFLADKKMLACTKTTIV
jgi:hypothetical protein